MPDDRDLTGDDRGRANISGEPLTATVRDILDEHADTERRALEEREAEEADRARMARIKADQERTAMRHTGGQRRLRRGARPERSLGSERDAEESTGIDPRLLVGAIVGGILLAGGLRRLIFLGALAAGGWALYRRVLEPARDPSSVLQ